VIFTRSLSSSTAISTSHAVLLHLLSQPLPTAAIVLVLRQRAGSIGLLLVIVEQRNRTRRAIEGCPAH
jgi:hypothetical protein